ncbi:MAG: HAD family hydrolase [Deltaproteobacteria bacterium]|nr:HAD family hydrolase [Deltaproteobacteria bacterium]
MKTAAVFLDRDGTINEETGYLRSLEDLRIFPESFEAVRLINRMGVLALVVTNQSGVARGFFDEAFVAAVHEELRNQMGHHGAVIDGFYYCPHHPTEGTGKYRITCDCRKPKPGMILQAARDFDIDLKRSYLIGDTLRDMETAENAGVTGVLVDTGYGKEISPADFSGDRFPTVLEAVRWIEEACR